MILLDPLGEPSRMAASRAIFKHALEAMPNEACGYAVLPKSLPDAVSIVVPVPNVDERPECRFSFPMSAVLEVEATERAGHRVAIWHSHPTENAELGEVDLGLALLRPQCLWLIASVPERAVRAWSVADGRPVEYAWTTQNAVSGASEPSPGRVTRPGS